MMLYVVIDFGYAKYSCHLMSVEFSVVFKIGCLFAESKEPPGPEMSPVGLSRWAACRTGTLRAAAVISEISKASNTKYPLVN